MLIQLHEGQAVTLETGDAISTGSPAWYLSRFDAAILYGTQNNYKLYRDGSVSRLTFYHPPTFFSSVGMSRQHDSVIHFQSGGPHYLSDPNTMLYDRSRPSPITYSGVFSAPHIQPVYFQGYYYYASAGNVIKANAATGATVETITLTGSLTFFLDRVDITPEGLLVGMDYDNGTHGVVRFYHLGSGETWESATVRSTLMLVDTVHKNIWSIAISSLILRTYSFDVAPYQFNPFTLGSNRSRYRQDAISGTLVGAQGEPVRFWPVGWRLTQPSMGGGFLGDFEVGYGALGSNGTLGPSAEGHLESDYTETDEDGVTTNTYCGPGAVDFVGSSATVEAWTGY